MTEPTPQSICVSLELAKNLRDSQYPQEATFRYIVSEGEVTLLLSTMSYFGSKNRLEYAAPTAEEIMRNSPSTISCIEKWEEGEKLSDMLAANYCLLFSEGLLSPSY